MPSNYGPFSTGTITFKVGDNSSAWVEDPNTGNYIPGPSHTTSLTYEVTLNMTPASSNDAPGTELVKYNCTGRVLHPSTLDPRISVGLVGQASLNGMQGRFVLKDIGRYLQPSYRQTLKQQIQGVFEQIGSGTLDN